MDWTYKHIALETVFPAPREAVAAALQSFLADGLSDWAVTEAATGAEARGLCGLHRAIATFAIEPAVDGTRLAVRLRVQRYSIWGYTLWDVGGYYDAQIRKWLRAIQWCLYQRLIAGAGRRDTTLDEWHSDWRLKSSSRAEKAVKIVMGWWLLGLFETFVLLPAIGLATGFLIVPGPGVLHGAAARTTSALLLAVAGHAARSTKRDQPAKD